MNFFLKLNSILLLSLFPVYSVALSFDDEQLISVIKKCSPIAEYHEVLYGIVKKESGGSAYAININGAYLNRQPTNKNEATSLISVIEESEYTFDIGVAQINSQHFKPNRVFGRLGYRPVDALDYCLNLKMATSIFDDAYKRTRDIKKALSIYNTGSPVRGLQNGYVESVLALMVRVN